MCRHTPLGKLKVWDTVFSLVICDAHISSDPCLRHHGTCPQINEQKQKYHDARVQSKEQHPGRFTRLVNLGHRYGDLEKSAAFSRGVCFISMGETVREAEEGYTLWSSIEPLTQLFCVLFSSLFPFHSHCIMLW